MDVKQATTVLINYALDHTHAVGSLEHRILIAYTAASLPFTLVKLIAEVPSDSRYSPIIVLNEDEVWDILDRGDYFSNNQFINLLSVVYEKSTNKSVAILIA
jgi:hypothetical protein